LNLLFKVNPIFRGSQRRTNCKKYKGQTHGSPDSIPLPEESQCKNEGKNRRIPSRKAWLVEEVNRDSIGTMVPTTIDWAQCPGLESVPGKVSGAWVFRGTRIPVSAILKNLKDLNVNEVVREFPAVTREQVGAVLDFVARSADPVFPRS
jgi:uncharacterized protein (DUF433 family)